LENQVPSTLLRALKKQKYHRIGNHTAVKRCKWLNEALTKNRSCYKQKFYGIKSHQCIQMSPSLFYCNQQCLFCWRAQKRDLNIKQDLNNIPMCDPPEEIIIGILKAQSSILSGYAGNTQIDWKKLNEASKPKHVAISLTGEPTFYEHLGELIQLLHKRGLTTFLVSNGTLPSKLRDLPEEPTQLYISVCAPNKEVFIRVCRPKITGAWEKLNETLSFLSSFNCPTVIRITLVDGYNMKNLEEYAKIITKASPTYIEAKAYMHVGFSGLRLSYDRMPSYEKIKHFSAVLSEKTGYKIIDESKESRVVLLSKRDKPIQFNNL
jgi:tRNA wybutosine-synthesizing protein 1